MSNPWHRFRSLPVASLVVRRRCLSELPGPLTAAPLVERRKKPWPLRRCALWVLNSGAQANARPAVRAPTRCFSKAASLSKRVIKFSFRAALLLSIRGYHMRQRTDRVDAFARQSHDIVAASSAHGGGFAGSEV